MAAGLPAVDLADGLYRVDPSQAVNKYIGETGKNVDEAVPWLGTGRGILFIEETDTPWWKRIELAHTYDRLANVETGFRPQRMEAFGGLASLTTNLVVKKCPSDGHGPGSASRLREPSEQ